MTNAVSFFCPISGKDSKFKILRVFSNIAFWLMLFAVAALASVFVFENSVLPYYARFTMVLGLAIGIVVLYFDAMYERRGLLQDKWNNMPDWGLGTKVGMMTCVNWFSTMIAWGNI